MNTVLDKSQLEIKSVYPLKKQIGVCQNHIISHQRNRHLTTEERNYIYAIVRKFGGEINWFKFTNHINKKFGLHLLFANKEHPCCCGKRHTDLRRIVTDLVQDRIPSWSKPKTIVDLNQVKKILVL